MERSPIEKSCCVCLTVGSNFIKLTKKDDNKVTFLTKFRMCIWEVQWLPSFYVCPGCSENLNTVHSFRERCIQSEIARKNQEKVLKTDDCTSRISEEVKPIVLDNQLKEENANDVVKDEKSLGIDTHESADSSTDFIDAFCGSNEEHEKVLDISKNEGDGEEVNTKRKLTKVHKQHHLNDTTNDRKSKRKKRKLTFTCQMCDKIFLASTKLISHCFNDHGVAGKDIKPFSCDRCPQRFGNSSNLWQHSKYHDGIKSNMCSYCGKGFITKTDLVNHEKKHLNMREYKCEPCGKSFNTHKDIRSHKLIVHTDPSRWKYVCTICSKPFPIKSNYDSHMRRHTGEKKFDCYVCNKKFITKCDLQRHTKSHSDVREYPCPHCEKEYKDERVLKVHLAKVHDISVGKVKIPVRERKYACHFCSKAYFAKNKLTRHLYTHSGEKPFNCPICEKKFNDKSYVKQHLRNTHNIESQEPVVKSGKQSYLHTMYVAELNDPLEF